MRSFSKRAGFTGVRCAYTVIPRELTGTTAGGERVPLHELWARRQATKFNGVPYVVQRAAEAVFSAEGRKQTEQQIEFYMENARLLREGLGAAGFDGVRRRARALPLAARRRAASPRGTSSTACSRRCHVVGTPGAGFGAAGEGFLRLSAFNSRENVEEAIARIRRELGR